MATEAEKRMHRCCFTGHRPEKLQAPEGVVTAALEKEIRQAIADGFNVFITGMARGVDICAGGRSKSIKTIAEAHPRPTLCSPDSVGTSILLGRA